jgi:hypothetical protein
MGMTLCPFSLGHHARSINVSAARGISEERVVALTEFHSEVTHKNFPYAETSISMFPDEMDKFLEALDKA